jgi:hypothetical protein
LWPEGVLPVLQFVADPGIIQGAGCASAEGVLPVLQFVADPGIIQRAGCASAEVVLQFVADPGIIQRAGCASVGMEGAADRKRVTKSKVIFCRAAGCIDYVSGFLGHERCAMGKVPTHLGMILAEGGEGAAARRRVAKYKVGIRIWSILSVLSLDDDVDVPYVI